MLMINVNYIKFVQQTAEIWPKDQILTFKKVPRGLVGLEVRVPPYSRVLCLWFPLAILYHGSSRRRFSVQDQLREQAQEGQHHKTSQEKKP